MGKTRTATLYKQTKLTQTQVQITYRIASCKCAIFYTTVKTAEFSMSYIWHIIFLQPIKTEMQSWRPSVGIEDLGFVVQLKRN